MNTLAQSPVVFLPDTHRYFLPGTGEYLSGITSMLARQLFPQKYEGIPQSTLDAAAEKGSAVHEECADYACFGTKGKLPETGAFATLLQAYGITPLEAEYTVSDERRFASKIDLVDNSYNLYDIKTTSSLDLEYIKWQLSCYAYLFEMQNPGVKAGELFAIHLRGKKGKLAKVERVPGEQIEALLQADYEGRQYTPEEHPGRMVPAEQEGTKEDRDIARLVDYENAIIALKEQIRQYETKKEQCLSALAGQMESRGIAKWETDRVILTRVAETQAVSLDSKALKEQMPDVYERFARPVTRKGFLRITVK